MLLNRLCWTFIATALLIAMVLASHLSWAMWYATISYVVLCLGVRLRKDRKRHPIVMTIAVGADLLLVLILQVQRGAIQTALAFSRPFLEQVHIGVSVTATALYLPVLGIGLYLWFRGSSPGLRRTHKVLGYSAFVFRTLGFLFMFSMIRPAPSTTQERLAVFPTAGLPLSDKVEVSWDKYQIPMIDAANESDAAFSLGMVHAHLRLGQMELMRRLSAGRLSEMAGPFAIQVDRAIRVLDLGRAAPEIERNLPPETKLWLQRYVAGINLYVERMPQDPPEFFLLGMKREKWQISDVLRLSRLAGADVSWMRLLGYFFLKNEKGFEAFWKRYSDAKTLSADTSPFALFSRTGSNSFAIAGSRTRNGAPILANDPHLGFSLPNFWVIVGIHCPTLHAVGFSIPGIPFIAVGRNQSLAWGGTNMHALSSDLYDVSEISAVQTTKSPISVRGWFDSEAETSWTAFGPIISGISFIKDSVGDKTISLRWMGHRPSDEITAFLKANRARSSEEFVSAFETYSVSGQNILFASKQDGIGQIFAVSLPKDRPPLSANPLRKPGEPDPWSRIRRHSDFPILRNPKDGLIISSNQKPAIEMPSVGEFFSPPQRAERLRELLSTRKAWDSHALSNVQQDVFSSSSFKMREALIGALQPVLKPEWSSWFEALKAWDGKYTIDSRGALVYQALVSSLIRRGYSESLGPKLVDFLLSVETGQDFVRLDLEQGDKNLVAALPLAADEVTQQIGDATWGDRHRLVLGHMLGNVPMIGQSFLFSDIPAYGSIETVTKSAHGLTAARHVSRYGAQARHISDLSDLDSNEFVLLGGQDGWWGSENFIDQLALWQGGRMVHVPLRVSEAKKLAVVRQTLNPN